ncbi:MAG: helix-turn-helix domain-containing protein, partial [Aestuariivirgaceae bacterium]
HGLWVDLGASDRKRQLTHMADRLQSGYPAYRCFLFDGRERYSVPYTVFGQQRAAIYVGDMFFVFNSTEHIRVLTGHFDDLIRHARIQPNECATYVRNLTRKVQ